MMAKITVLLRLLSANLALSYFGLMGLGLVLSTLLLVHADITGSEWVTVCGILFGSGRVGDAIDRLGGNKNDN